MDIMKEDLVFRHMLEDFEQAVKENEKYKTFESSTKRTLLLGVLAGYITAQPTEIREQGLEELTALQVWHYRKYLQ